MSDEEYEKNMQAKIDILKPLLDEKFLSTLIEAAKTCGWDVDHIETISFVHWCHEVMGVESPDITAYEYETRGNNMFDLNREIDSRWETEKRWVKDGKQQSSTDIGTKKLTMRIAKSHTGFVKIGETLPPLRTVLTFEGGPTGHEAYYLSDLSLEGEGDFCICAGTPNRWPACYVNMAEVNKFVEEYKATAEIA